MSNKYYVYYNLHKHVFSCKDLKTNRVNKDFYSTTVKMENCEFRVGQKRRQKILDLQAKRRLDYLSGCEVGSYDDLTQSQKEIYDSIRGQKNVHAGVVGTVLAVNLSMDELDDQLNELTELTYNPYFYDSFVTKDTKQKVVSAETVYLLNRRIFAKNVLTA